MKKNSKRFLQLKALIKKQFYSYQEASLLIKELSTTNFNESIEVHIKLNFNNKDITHQLRTNLMLPHGTGKPKKIAVFTEDSNTSKMLSYGAIIAGFDNVLNQIQTKSFKFNVLLTTPNLVPILTKFGKILGPKNLMPSSKNGTVTEDLKQTILDYTQNKIEYKTDKTGIIHIICGTKIFSVQNIQENLLAIYNSIYKNKPLNLKGQYIKSFYICMTMSPSILIDLNSFKL